MPRRHCWHFPNSHKCFWELSPSPWKLTQRSLGSQQSAWCVDWCFLRTAAKEAGGCICQLQLFQILLSSQDECSCNNQVCRQQRCLTRTGTNWKWWDALLFGGRRSHVSWACRQPHLLPAPLKCNAVNIASKLGFWLHSKRNVSNWQGE